MLRTPFCQLPQKLKDPTQAAQMPKSAENLPHGLDIWDPRGKVLNIEWDTNGNVHLIALISVEKCIDNWKRPLAQLLWRKVPNIIEPMSLMDRKGCFPTAKLLSIHPQVFHTPQEQQR